MGHPRFLGHLARALRPRDNGACRGLSSGHVLAPSPPPDHDQHRLAGVGGGEHSRRNRWPLTEGDLASLPSSCGTNDLDRIALRCCSCPRFSCRWFKSVQFEATPKPLEGRRLDICNSDDASPALRAHLNEVSRNRAAVGSPVRVSAVSARASIVMEPLWILETKPDGHRLWYVRLLVDAAQSAGRPLVLYTSQCALDSPEWITHMKGSEVRVQLIDDIDWHTLLTTARDSGARVVVPDADKQLARIAFAARFDQIHPRDRSLVTVLVMRPLKQPGPRGAAALALKLVVAAGARANLTSMRFVALSSDSRRIGLMTRCRLAEIAMDPVTANPLPMGRSAWLSDHGISPAEAILAIVGDVSERKCAPQVVTAFGQLPETTALSLVLVGRLDEMTTRAVEKLGPSSLAKVHVFPGYLAAEDFDSWIAYADAVMVMHTNAGSSGVLLKSVAMGTPAIVGGHKSVKASAKALGGRYDICDTTTSAIGEALLRLKPREDVRPPKHVDLRGFADRLLGL